MSVAVICLGSNTPEGRSNIADATAKCSAIGDVEAASDIYPSPNGYLNRVIRLSTSLAAAPLNIKLKEIEAQMGRRAEMKNSGIVPIDIDVVIFDNEVLRDFDYRQKYFKEGYLAL